MFSLQSKKSSPEPTERHFVIRLMINTSGHGQPCVQFQQRCGSSLSHIVSNVGGGLSHPPGLEPCFSEDVAFLESGVTDTLLYATGAGQYSAILLQLKTSYSLANTSPPRGSGGDLGVGDVAKTEGWIWRQGYYGNLTDEEEAKYVQDFWTALADDHENDPGRKAYASKVASMYEQMEKNMCQQFEKVGGTWLKVGVSLAQYIKSERPDPSIDWTADVE
ncbi:hypothetical protein DFH09DRAFT_1102544 [Mycena vulgaris]|nr:hypothetical protein DFH09DRAFT_1102544 [Mycena vulgaris]